jgi:hypothetical protein
MSDLASFPFPFRSDTFRYSTNVEPARVPVATPTGGWGAHVLNVDSDYRADLRLREAILVSDPSRAAVLEHMRPAAWDALLMVLTELAATCPAAMSLTQQGSSWRWRNDLLGVEHTFAFGRDETLPCPPLQFAASQTPDDLVLLDQCGDVLRADAGVVTFAADWSLGFVVGMSFQALHAPVDAAVHRAQVIGRAHDVLLRLDVGADIRRTNWALTLGRALDRSLERHPLRGAPRLPAGDLGQVLHLRVELQHLIRLPTSGAILFTIRTYHLSLAELATVPSWLRRFTAIICELPAELLAAKSMTGYYEELRDWLLSR